MKILYIQANGIGNTILSTPSMQAIRQLYPDTRYDLLIDRVGFPVVEGWPIFNNIYKDDINKSDIQYDMVVLSEPRNDNRFMPLATKSKKIVMHSGSHYKTHKIRPRLKHEVVINMEIAESLGYQGEYPPLYMKIAPDDDRFQVNKNKIGIHIGATNSVMAEKKKWPISRWIEIIKTLNPENVFLIGSCGEKKDVDYICNKSGAYNACNKFSLSETTRLIKNSRLFISTDSGPMHIAAAVSTPVIALFGGTSADKNGPWTPKGKSMVLKPNIICSPCIFTLRYRTCRDYKCMEKITVSQVLKSFDKMVTSQDFPKGYCYKDDLSLSPYFIKHWHIFYDIFSFLKYKFSTKFACLYIR